MICRKATVMLPDANFLSSRAQNRGFCARLRQARHLESAVLSQEAPGRRSFGIRSHREGATWAERTIGKPHFAFTVPGLCSFFFLLALAGGCYCVSLSIMKFLVLVIFIFCFESTAVGQGEPAHLAPAHLAVSAHLAPAQQQPAAAGQKAPAHLAPAQLCWVDSKDFAERDCSFLYEPGVRVRINAPAEGLMTPRKSVRLIFYALPNGNSTEWTFGKRMEQGNDWHFDIQHIGAQSRFLRAVDTLHSYVVVYLRRRIAVGVLGARLARGATIL